MSEDLYCSHGPVSSMPGSVHALPDGTMCDTHEDRPAVRRIQGETDSFGCEYVCLCQQCLDEYRAYQASEEATTGTCDWCKSRATDLANRRDSDEGMAGPMYRVCGACRKKDNERYAAELAEMDRETGRDDYLFDDDGRDEYSQGF